MTSFAIMLSVALGFLFGFATQRWSLCAVSAIGPLIADKTFGSFLSFLRCSAWDVVVSLPVWWLCPAARVSKIYAFAPAGLAGAAAFGPLTASIGTPTWSARNVSTMPPQGACPYRCQQDAAVGAFPHTPRCGVN